MKIIVPVGAVWEPKVTYSKCREYGERKYSALQETTAMNVGATVTIVNSPDHSILDLRARLCVTSWSEQVVKVNAINESSVAEQQ